MRECPILKAGTMVTTMQAKIHYATSGSLLLGEDGARCMEEGCEWYQRGCPAHPSATYPSIPVTNKDRLEDNRKRLSGLRRKVRIDEK